MRISRKPRILEVRHPVHPEVLVRARAFTEIERMEVGRKVVTHVAELVREPGSKQGVFDQKTHQQMVYVRTEPVPFSKIAQMLKPYIMDIEGLEIEEGETPAVEDLTKDELAFWADRQIEDPMNGQDWIDPATGETKKVVMDDEGKPKTRRVWVNFVSEVMDQLLTPARNGDEAKKEFLQPSIGP